MKVTRHQFVQVFNQTILDPKEMQNTIKNSTRSDPALSTVTEQMSTDVGAAVIKGEGQDGLIDSKAEWNKVFDAIDNFDVNGDRDSVALGVNGRGRDKAVSIAMNQVAENVNTLTRDTFISSRVSAESEIDVNLARESVMDEDSFDAMIATSNAAGRDNIVSGREEWSQVFDTIDDEDVNGNRHSLDLTNKKVSVLYTRINELTN